MTQRTTVVNTAIITATMLAWSTCSAHGCGTSYEAAVCIVGQQIAVNSAREAPMLDEAFVAKAAGGCSEAPNDYRASAAAPRNVLRLRLDGPIQWTDDALRTVGDRVTLTLAVEGHQATPGDQVQVSCDRSDDSNPELVAADRWTIAPCDAESTTCWRASGAAPAGAYNGAIITFTIRVTRDGQAWCARLPVVIQADHPRQINVELGNAVDKMLPHPNQDWRRRTNRLSVTTWVPWFPSQGTVPVRLVLDTASIAKSSVHEGVFEVFEPGAPDRSLSALMLSPAPQSASRYTSETQVDGGEEFPIGAVPQMWKTLEANRMACRVARKKSIDPTDVQGTDSTAWGVKRVFLWVY